MSHSIIVEPNDSNSEPERAQEKTAQPAASESTIPEKYQGKTFEDVVKMHQNLEKEYGRQANEVGTYRELVSSLAETKRATDLSQTDTTEKQSVEITSDDIFDNPTEAISNVVKSVLERELAPLHQQQAASRHEQALAQLKQEHPDLEAIGADPDFQQYVASNEYRLMDAQKWVNEGDVTSAKRLLDDYKANRRPQSQSNESTTTPAKEQRVVQTESGRGGSSPQGEVLYRDEVMRLIAKDPEKYRSPSFQAKLRKAIAEGRFVE